MHAPRLGQLAGQRVGASAKEEAVTRVFAISDLHVNYAENWRAVTSLPACPDDWLVLAGDIAEQLDLFAATLELLRPRFRGIVWVPGNHDLWSHSHDGELHGPAKYRRLVEICRALGVVTPEDAYPIIESAGHRYRLAALFLLYDYSFRPPEILTTEAALAWAAESDVVCADELRLSPAPFATREAWCHERVAYTRARLDALDDTKLVLVNHFPLRRDLAVLPAIPRFSIWCGTTLSEQWHTRYPVEAVVYGHLHLRGTRWRDGVRFEEVSLGRPSEWRARGGGARVRQILPAVGEVGVEARHP
jgi:3',5'-cyclic AMP phosphodiesterase CpdA